MKIAISKSILENILLHVQPFLEKKDTSQITSHVYLEAKTDTLTLKATDYEIGLHIQTPKVQINETGMVTSNGKKLLDIIRILKDQEIILETRHNMLHIQQGNSNFKLPTFNSSEYPPFPSYENHPKIAINSHILIESLKKITPATDTNNPKFELNGALLDISQDAINFVSTDTRRLALVHVQNSNEKALALILPKKAIIEIQKLFFDAIEIYYDDTHVMIKSEQFLFFTKLINGKFPDYSRIIPKELSKNLRIPKSDIIGAIKQITTISNDMKMTFHHNHIIFESLSDDNIEAKTEIYFETGFEEPFVLALNSRYILDFLSQITESEFTIGLNEPNLPFVLSEGNFKTIIMPIVI
ncbi:MAG: DNA polymerase III subunit beta [Sulfurimonas sp.]|nr:MAG: DNA polymerase III subunit beta [Sulfurimonas sp.]